MPGKGSPMVTGGWELDGDRTVGTVQSVGTRDVSRAPLPSIGILGQRCQEREALLIGETGGAVMQLR